MGRRYLNVNNYIHNNGAWGELIDDFVKLLPDGVGLSEPDGGVRGIIAELIEGVRGGGFVTYLLLCLGLTVLVLWVECSLGERIRAALPYILVAYLFTLAVPLFTLVEAMLDALFRLGELFSLILPIFVSAAVGMGAVGVASAQGVGFGMVLSLLAVFVDGVLAPLCAAILLLSVLSPLLEGSGLNIGRGLGCFFTRGTVIATSVLSAGIAFQTVIAAARDSVALRAARLAVGNALPVVGSALSGALSSLVGGFSYVSGVIGSFSLISVLSIALSPLALALLYKLALFLSSCLLSASGADCASAALSSLCRAFDCAISVFALLLVVYGLECFAFATCLQGGGL